LPPSAEPDLSPKVLSSVALEEVELFGVVAGIDAAAAAVIAEISPGSIEEVAVARDGSKIVPASPSFAVVCTLTSNAVAIFEVEAVA
jgi:hypothetical protein